MSSEIKILKKILNHWIKREREQGWDLKGPEKENKKYVEELEFRIKCLEKENMKLRQELERNKDNNQEEECKTKLKQSEEVEKFPAKIEKKFYNEKSELVESKTIDFEEFFQK